MLTNVVAVFLILLLLAELYLLHQLEKKRGNRKLQSSDTRNAEELEFNLGIPIVVIGEFQPPDDPNFQGTAITENQLGTLLRGLGNATKLRQKLFCKSCGQHKMPYLLLEHGGVEQLVPCTMLATERLPPPLVWEQGLYLSKVTARAMAISDVGRIVTMKKFLLLCPSDAQTRSLIHQIEQSSDSASNTVSKLEVNRFVEAQVAEIIERASGNKE